MRSKYLLVTPSLNGGGAEKILLFVANALAVNNEVTVISYLSGDVANLDSSISLNILDNKYQDRKILGKLLRMWQIRKYIRNQNVNCVIGFGPEFAIICVLSALFTKTKVLTSERRSPEDLSIYWRFIAKIAYSLSDGVVFQLDQVRDYFNLRKDKVAVIPNPYFQQKIDESEVLRFEKRNKIIISAAARLNELEKGIDVLCDAFLNLTNLFPDYQLHIYGEDRNDELKIRYQQFSKKIYFFERDPDIVLKINKAAVFVLPSRVEGIPNILLEAMGAGNVTVSSDCPPGGPRLLTSNGQWGALFENGNSESLRERLTLVLSDPEICNQLITYSQLVKGRFDKAKIEKEWVDFCEYICGK